MEAASTEKEARRIPDGHSLTITLVDVAEVPGLEGQTGYAVTYVEARNSEMGEFISGFMHSETGDSVVLDGEVPEWASPEVVAAISGALHAPAA